MEDERWKVERYRDGAVRRIELRWAEVAPFGSKIRNNTYFKTLNNMLRHYRALRETVLHGMPWPSEGQRVEVATTWRVAELDIRKGDGEPTDNEIFVEIRRRVEAARADARGIVERQFGEGARHG